jgi:hypothetical protein
MKIVSSGHLDYRARHVIFDVRAHDRSKGAPYG